MDDPEKMFKPALAGCQHENAFGCALHGKPDQPAACAMFHCPYQEREGLWRPDNFQVELEMERGNIGNYIPAVPKSIPLDEARRLIRETKTILASVIIGGRWVDFAVPLLRRSDGSWTPGDMEPWERSKTTSLTMA